MENYYFGKVSFCKNDYPAVVTAINLIRSKETAITVGRCVERGSKAVLPFAFMEKCDGLVPKGYNLHEIERLFKGCEFEASKLAPCVENANDLIAAESIESCMDNAMPLRVDDIMPLKKQIDGDRDFFAGFVGLDDQVELLKSIAKAISVYGRDSLESAHLLFAGNPGTGKSTMAKAFGAFAKDAGIVTGSVRQVSAENLVGKYAGTTPSIVRQEFRKARGGVLFIDEAYRLAPRNDHDNPYGYEAINAITELMERERGDVLVICAGYSDEMDRFLKVNSGLGDRFGFHVEFPDYGPDALVDIFAGMAKGRGFTLEEEARPYLINVCGEMKRNKSFANARSVRKLLDHTVIVMATHFGTGKAIDSDAIREAYEASGLGWNAKPAIGFTA